MVQPEEVFRPFPSGIAHFLFFSPPEIKTILSQKHSFCSTLAEPASVTPSGRHQMGHCLLFSPSKLQLRENKSHPKKPHQKQNKNPKPSFHILFYFCQKIVTNAHPEFLSVFLPRFPSFMCTEGNEACGKGITCSEMKYHPVNWSHNPWVS